jgi:hypothetical protein
MAKADSIFQTQMNRQRNSVFDRIVPPEPEAWAGAEDEPALNVVTVYQDPLTRQWTTELWDRVGQLVSSGGIGTKAWKISDLTQTLIFADAVEAAAEADVLVISVRDAGELPLRLHVWIDAWMPRRVGRPGALVALIGVPAQPHTQVGRAHRYLEAVARRAGLDFLPRERKLPKERRAAAPQPGITTTAAFTMPWSAGGSTRGAGTNLYRALIE